MTLREVEALTGGAVKNGYLSQIENGHVSLVSPGILFELATVYDVSYGELMERAGHKVPRQDGDRNRGVIAGLPLRAIAKLDPEDRQALIDYVAFLQQKKRR